MEDKWLLLLDKKRGGDTVRAWFEKVNLEYNAWRRDHNKIEKKEPALMTTLARVLKWVTNIDKAKGESRKQGVGNAASKDLATSLNSHLDSSTRGAGVDFEMDLAHANDVNLHAASAVGGLQVFVEPNKELVEKITSKKGKKKHPETRPAKKVEAPDEKTQLLIATAKATMLRMNIEPWEGEQTTLCKICQQPKNAEKFNHEGMVHMELNARRAGVRVRTYCPLADDPQIRDEALERKKGIKRKNNQETYVRNVMKSKLEDQNN
mmetsp:Transcript_17224/g.37198  ORF Transcript_17224/g.37198 Transcript_17224/m.37198 type:complete len:264 (-) Transcript_17224:56-847(-)